MKSYGSEPRALAYQNRRVGRLTIVSFCAGVSLLDTASAEILHVSGNRKLQHVIPSNADDPIPTVSQGLLGQTTFLATGYIYNTASCSLVTDGDWTALTSPNYGSISTKIVNAPIEVVNNPGNCNGTVIPQNYVYETLSYGNIQAATDNFTLGFWSCPRQLG